MLVNRRRRVCAVRLTKMFKFSFQKSDEADYVGNEGEIPTEEKQESLKWLSSEKVKVMPSHLKSMLSLQGSITHTSILNISLDHLSTESVLNRIKKESTENSSVKLAEELHSDLVPAKYEGGLKIWEGTVDLLEWLLSNNPDTSLKSKHVLDLGCGAGLLGIAALKCGANVTFQDYNREVLESCTIPNVLLNLSDELSQLLIERQDQKHVPCEFYSGDWSSFPNKLCEGRDEIKFDVILTSETIYNPENYHKLCEVFKKCLKKSGYVYLAAKTHYFGVGGGLRQFETALLKDGIFKSEVCWRCPSGISREILKISFLL